MDINASAAHGGVEQLSVSQKAAEVAVAQKRDQLAAKGIQFETVNSVNDVDVINSPNNAGSNAPNVSTSPTYSPSLYAQAAQFQLYSQSGTLASLLAQQGVAPQVDTPYKNDSTEIHAVEGPSASTIDTHA